MECWHVASFSVNGSIASAGSIVNKVSAQF